MKNRPSYDDRRSNYYAHQGENLKAREELIRRGVKKDTTNMPSMDATHQGMAKRLREGDSQVQNHMNGTGALTDKEARAAGFKSAAEMQAFYMNRRRNRGGSKLPQGKGAPTNAEQQAAPPPKKRATSIWDRITNAMNGN